MFQILPALFGTTLVTGLVLGSDQCMRTAAPFGCEVKVARGVSDALLDVGPPVLGRPQAPLLLMRVYKECTEFTTVVARAFEGVGPRPVPWGLQRQGDATAQMVESRLAQPADGRPRHALRLLGEGQCCLD